MTVALHSLTHIDVYESASKFILVGHNGDRCHLLHVDRRPQPATAVVVAAASADSSGSAVDDGEAAAAVSAAAPPVEEDPRSYSEAACREQLAAASALEGPLVQVLRGAPADQQRDSAARGAIGPRPRPATSARVGRERAIEETSILSAGGRACT